MYKTPSQLECPICRQNTTKRFEELPKNRLITQFIELNAPTNSQSVTNPAHDFSPPHYNSAPPYPNTNPTAPHIQIPVYHDFENSSSTLNSAQAWDDKKFFRDIFNDIDHNGDGRINFHELHAALQQGNPNSEFDQKTVRILLNKFDRDHDNEIDFDEFHNLFIGINNQYNEFLDIDLDFSGTIDSSELTNALTRKGYNLSKNFFDFLINEVNRYARGNNSITFDMYVRIIARIDYLRANFNKAHNSSRASFEAYLRDNFFLEF